MNLILGTHHDRASLKLAKTYAAVGIDEVPALRMASIFGA
jgi:hypothetical protein